MTARPEFPLIVVTPVDSEIRLIQIGPGVNAAEEPLLSHAGLACELGGKIEVAMTGITGTSELIRQFLTTVGNDLTREVLTALAKELNNPVRRFGVRPAMRTRIDQIRTDLDDTPKSDPSDTPEP
ncbi:hypothetical protein [Pontitalea aquivivens]|uniref:hypothetical protein n=1 Tax=Pontitalea aquivivens TaxID=3388663 RepID=UPI003970934E